jgi:P-type E1-E2 ATPase
MLTGDHPAVAETVAKQLDISRYLADAFPEQKSDFVRSLQQEGRKVAVVTNGRIPSLALAQADVRITVGGGVDVTQETAAVVLLNGNLWQIPRAIDLAREGIARNRQNRDLLLYSNTTAIALSLLGVLEPLGVTLLSKGSALLAILNARRPLRGSK